FEHAFELGSDAIEFDVVMTRDGVPVIRHDRDLSHTTDIALHSYLTKMVDELDYQDIKQLRAIERYPDGRKESAVHNGRYAIPSLDRVLQNPKFDGKHLIIEIKYGEHFQAAGLDPVAAVAQSLEDSKWRERGLQITVECFEFDILRQAKDRIGAGVSFVFLSAGRYSGHLRWPIGCHTDGADWRFGPARTGARAKDAHLHRAHRDRRGGLAGLVPAPGRNRGGRNLL
ncbi:MAG: glycerophosphodiester phosphodiesterase family protein, partial [Aquiluna sp.]